MDYEIKLVLLPGSNVESISIGRNSWEKSVYDHYEDSTVRVFLFKEKMIFENPWDTILKKQLYSQKIEVTVSDLNKLNWKIVYE